MKKIFLMGLSVLTVLFASCGDDDNNSTYTGTNVVRISTTDATQLRENSLDTINVTVLLTNTATKDETITFALENNSGDVLGLTPSVVNIAAGEKTATVKVFSNGNSVLTEQRTVSLTATAFSSSNMKLEGALSIVVTPSPNLSLNDEQKQLIAGYRERYGVDLYEFLGEKTCVVHVTFPLNEIGEYAWVLDDEHAERTFSTSSVFTLSESATAEKPVLKMIDNPMGMTSLFTEIFKAVTYADTEFWYYDDPESGAPSNYKAMLQAINFNAETEVFTAVLDNIELNMSDGSIVFTAEQYDEEMEESYERVPFEFSYTAWNRWKQKAENGESIEIYDGLDEDGNPKYVEEEVSQLIEWGVTINPAYYLLGSDVSYDAWSNEPSDWIQPEASFDVENGTLEFVFPWDHYNSYGYTQLQVRYQLR